MPYDPRVQFDPTLLSSGISQGAAAFNHGVSEANRSKEEKDKQKALLDYYTSRDATEMKLKEQELAQRQVERAHMQDIDLRRLYLEEHGGPQLQYQRERDEAGRSTTAATEAARLAMDYYLHNKPPFTPPTTAIAIRDENGNVISNYAANSEHGGTQMPVHPDKLPQWSDNDQRIASMSTPDQKQVRIAQIQKTMHGKPELGNEVELVPNTQNPMDLPGETRQQALNRLKNELKMHAVGGGSSVPAAPSPLLARPAAPMGMDLLGGQLPVGGNEGEMPRSMGLLPPANFMATPRPRIGGPGVTPPAAPIAAAGNPPLPDQLVDLNTGAVPVQAPAPAPAPSPALPRVAERKIVNAKTGETLVLRNGQWVPLTP